MKNLISVIAAGLLVISVAAQDIQNDAKGGATYCAMLKDGKIMLMAEGKQVNNDVTLANGTIVRTDGTVEKADKTKVTLKNGDCIDQDGNIIPSDKKRGDKMIQNDKDKKSDYNK